jgi:hypothetical protein
MGTLQAGNDTAAMAAWRKCDASQGYTALHQAIQHGTAAFRTNDAVD